MATESVLYLIVALLTTEKHVSKTVTNLSESQGQRPCRFL
jgi:hypothetical protein